MFLKIQYKDQQKFAIDCKITDNLFFNKYMDSYIQHYSKGKKLDKNLPYPYHKPICSKFVGNIVNIDKYYKQLNCDKKYILKDNTLPIETYNYEKFIYRPWQCFFKENQEPICTLIWDKNDFLMTVNTDKKSGKGTFKTFNGDGIKILNIGTHIDIFWDERINRKAYMSDQNTIKVQHGEKWYEFKKLPSHTLFSAALCDKAQLKKK